MSVDADRWLRSSLDASCSTTRYTTEEAPPVRPPGAIVGSRLTYRDDSGSRAGEGGMRTRGVYKSSVTGSPLVSVVTVCRNAERTIRQTIDSVLDQTYPNIEYVLVDGCSDDGTLSIIQEYGDRVDYFVSEKDGGIYQAMNKGLALASGEYVLMLNADDWYDRTCVESLVRARWCCGATFSAGLAQYVDDQGNPTRLLRHMPFDASARIRMPLRHETMLVPATVYDSLGPYDESFGIISDFEFTVRLYDAGCSLIEVQKPLLYFRETGVSNRNREALFAERAELMRRRFPRLEADEAVWFSKLPELTAEQMNLLHDKYGFDDELSSSLFAYGRDRRRQPAQQGWRDAEGSFFAALQALPSVSVIVPYFNAEDTLAECLESILGQTFADLEVIAVDDQSPDGSHAIVERYAREDSRIRSLRNERNLGLGASRNRGVAAARGEYAFHIDPDDTIPADAIRLLYSAAAEHGSELVKGSYLRGQFVHGQPGSGTVRIDLLDGKTIVNTDLRTTPDLLRTTEGHWSYLYKMDLARRIPYPNDLKMGQDSIFLVNALIAASSVTVTDHVVYHYNANPGSAMNTFTFRKFMDALEWRARAHRALVEAGHRRLGIRMLCEYWSDAFFAGLVERASKDQVWRFFERLRQVFGDAGLSEVGSHGDALVASVLRLVLLGENGAAVRRIRSGHRVVGASVHTDVAGAQSPCSPGERALKVATWSSFDHGGAGTGTQRRVASLRSHGVDARIFSLVKRSDHAYVKRVVPTTPELRTRDQLEVWTHVRKHSVESVTALDGFKARELFSVPYSVVDLSEVASGFDEFDVIHLHWVVGMLDLQNLGTCWADKPVVWTLADMNAFTGGCHYSEGCEGYKNECRDCPMLGAHADIAHRAWKTKKEAYSRMRNLQIICPSKWLAKKASESSLLGDRTVHYIPNAFPTDEFVPVNRIVARVKLGLPLRKRLLAFGADNLNNKRKGGDLVRESLLHLERENKLDDIEVVAFGNNRLDLPVKVHYLGFISDSRRLSLAYSAADAYLFPSREDNAPLTVGEALLCGTPAVAYPVGHVPDLVRHGETGYIAKYSDFVDFANGILRMLDVNDQDRLRIAAQAHHSAREFHDPEMSVSEHLKVYQLALEASAPDVGSRPAVKEHRSAEWQ